MKTQNMEKRNGLSKIIGLFLLLISCVMLIVPDTKGYAAKKSKIDNEDIQKILKEKVKNKYGYYGYIDLDYDGIDEMVVKQYNGKICQGDHDQTSIIIYKYVDGSVKRLFKYSIKGSYSMPNLRYEFWCEPVTEYEGKAKYLVIHDESEEEWNTIIYSCNGKKLKKVAKCEEFEGNKRFFIKGKETTEKKYNDFVAIRNRMMLRYPAGTPINQKKLKKYYRKKVMAAFDFAIQYRYDDINVADVEYVYADLDSDGYDELIVKGGGLGVKIFDESNTREVMDIQKEGSYISFSPENYALVYTSFYNSNTIRNVYMISPMGRYWELLDLFTEDDVELSESGLVSETASWEFVTWKKYLEQ